MDSLVFANISHRPMRSLVTALGVSIGTVLILLIVGLAHGITRERGARDANMAAEIMVRPAGSFTTGLSSNNLSLPLSHIAEIQKIPGVQSVAPVGQYVQNTDTGLGFRITDAIDFDSYSQTTGIRLISGKPPANDDEIVVDEEYAGSNKLKVGDSVKTLDRTFKLAGVYSPQVGARLKVRLTFLQSMLASENNCSMFLVKCANPADQEQVAARINSTIPDLQLIFIRDLPRLYAEGIPALNVFLKVLIGLAIFISTLVILLAMYTAITERTKEIGVLKSLGASRTFIVWSIEKEALLISLLGVLIGYGVAVLTRFLLIKFTSLKNIDYELHWLLITAGIGLLGGVLGALYPAIYAARKDPVEALSYE